jgi:hypothetical protein
MAYPRKFRTNQDWLSHVDYMEVLSPNLTNYVYKSGDRARSYYYTEDQIENLILTRTADWREFDVVHSFKDVIHGWKT